MHANTCQSLCVYIYKIKFDQFSLVDILMTRQQMLYSIAQHTITYIIRFVFHSPIYIRKWEKAQQYGM